MFVGIIVTVCILMFLLYRFNHINLNKLQPNNGYQLLKIIESGKPNSLTKVTNHIVYVAFNPTDCTTAEVYAATKATLGYILKVRSIELNGLISYKIYNWTNREIYVQVKVNLITAHKHLNERSISEYDSFYKNILFLMKVSNSDKFIQSRFQHYAEWSLQIYQNPQNKREKKIRDTKLKQESIGTLMVEFMKAAAEDRKNSYMEH